MLEKSVSLPSKREDIEMIRRKWVFQLYLHRSIAIDAYPLDVFIAKQSRNSPVLELEYKSAFETIHNSPSKVRQVAIPDLHESRPLGELAAKADVAWACVRNSTPTARHG